jgi:feruloyl esterase
MRRLRTTVIICTGSLVTAVPIAVVTLAGQAGEPAARCSAVSAIAKTDLPVATTTIVAATQRPAAAAQLPGIPGTAATPALPEHCEVVGRLNERVGLNKQKFATNFRLRLPAEWNGRFFFQGGGGTNGNVGDALGALQGAQPTVALALGYAVVSQDSGHDNATNGDRARGGAQAFGFDPDARRDFGYRSYDEVTRTAKAIVEKHYGRPIEKSYFAGCSEGGREGMMFAQRFPQHFDGILACAPGFRLPQAALGALADSQVFASLAKAIGALDTAGRPLVAKTFTDEDLALVAGAALEACDRRDGLVDGLIQNFTACTNAAVVPELKAITCTGEKTSQCLSAGQVTALTTVMGGVKLADGQLAYAPRVWDSGIGGRVGNGFNAGWRIWKLGGYDSTSNSSLDLNLSATATASIFTTPPTAVDTSGGQVAYGLTVNLAQARRTMAIKTAAYRESVLEVMKADATDLSAFRKRSGKLVIVHGVSDPVFSIADTVDWWNAVNKIEGGKASEFVRLYAVPGMNHCAGGPSTDQFNAFAALVDWVEKDSAPDRIIATARAGTPWPGRTRPLCPYPQQARYTASGSIEDAANFVCR